MPETPVQRQSRCKLLAKMALEIMKDPEATVAQKLEAMKWYNEHRDIRPGSKGKPENLKKKNNKDILG